MLKYCIMSCMCINEHSALLMDVIYIYISIYSIGRKLNYVNYDFFILVYITYIIFFGVSENFVRASWNMNYWVNRVPQFIISIRTAPDAAHLTKLRL